MRPARPTIALSRLSSPPRERKKLSRFRIASKKEGAGERQGSFDLSHSPNSSKITGKRVRPSDRVYHKRALAQPLGMESLPPIVPVSGADAGAFTRHFPVGQKPHSRGISAITVQADSVCQVRLGCRRALTNGSLFLEISSSVRRSVSGQGFGLSTAAVGVQVQYGYF